MGLGRRLSGSPQQESRPPSLYAMSGVIAGKEEKGAIGEVNKPQQGMKPMHRVICNSYQIYNDSIIHVIGRVKTVQTEVPRLK